MPQRFFLACHEQIDVGSHVALLVCVPSMSRRIITPSKTITLYMNPLIGPFLWTGSRYADYRRLTSPAGLSLPSRIDICRAVRCHRSCKRAEVDK